MGLISSANYLVQLYYKTGENYKLTRNKLQCLLIIAELCHMKCGSRKYEVPISFYYNNLYGFKKISFDVLSSFYFNNIVINKQNKDKIANNNINAYPKRYETNNIPKEERVLLEEIFNQYGNYSTSDLIIIIEDFFNDLLKNQFKSNKSNININETPSKAIIFNAQKFRYYELISSKLVTDFVDLNGEGEKFFDDSLFDFISKYEDDSENNFASYCKKINKNS